MRSSLLIMLFKSPTPNFFLLVLTFSEGGKLKFSSKVVKLAVFHFTCIIIYFEARILVTSILLHLSMK